MAVTFEDYSINVKGACSDAAEAFLYEAAELLKGSAAQASPVASGQLKGSWDYQIEGTEAKVGSPLENALWNEFGTGEFADFGGRKGGWNYQDVAGNWHHTHGKRARHTLQSAFASCKGSILRRAEQIFKDRMG